MLLCVLVTMLVLVSLLVCFNMLVWVSVFVLDSVELALVWVSIYCVDFIDRLYTIYILCRWYRVSVYYVNVYWCLG